MAAGLMGGELDGAALAVGDVDATRSARGPHCRGTERQIARHAIQLRRSKALTPRVGPLSILVAPGSSSLRSGWVDFTRDIWTT